MSNDTPRPKKRRSWRKILSITAIAMAALVYALRTGCEFWCFGWQKQELSFHESWSEAHRKQLQELGDVVRYELVLSYRPKSIDEELYTPSLSELLENKAIAAEEGASFAKLIQLEISYLYAYTHASVAMRDELKELYSMLHQVAASGRGDARTKDGCTAAHLAAHSSKLDLLRELVRRGADPNAAHHSETVFQTAIACQPLPDVETERASQRERLETLDWLLSHGATIDNHSPDNLSLAFISDLHDQTDDEEAPTIPGATLEWLLDHGLRIENADSLSVVIMLKGALPTAQRLMQKGYLSKANAPALLQKAVMCTHADAADKARWALSLGAEPNSEAVSTCRFNLQLYDDTTDEDDMQAFTSALLVLDVLLEHGATLSDPAHTLPKDEPQKTLYLELLKKHHIPCPVNN